MPVKRMGVKISLLHAFHDRTHELRADGTTSPNRNVIRCRPHRID